MSNAFLTTNQLAERIQYDVRTIREQLKDSVLIEGVQRWPILIEQDSLI